MRIQGIYAAIAVNDIAAAEEFYTILFDRVPGDRPMPNLIQWRGVAGANIQIFEADGAGASLCTIVVPQMDEARASLEAAGLSLFGEREGVFGKLAKINDPSGNTLTIAEPPNNAGA